MSATDHPGLKVDQLRVAPVRLQQQGMPADVAADEFKYAPETNANAILFHDVCTGVLEKMRAAKSTNARLDLLLPFWKRIGKQSSFPFMRLLLPQLDCDRANYGLKTTKLAKLYADMYFEQKSEQYQRLVHHTDPLKNPSPDKDWQIAGDFPLTLEYVLQNKPGLEKSTCTLQEVNDVLDELKRASNDDMRKRVIRKFRQNFSPMNQKWLVRIVLRDLKIQLKKDSILKRIHEDALDEYNRTTSLRKVCTVVVGRHSSLRFQSDLQVFTSFYPMLAKNFHYSMEKIVPSFKGRPFCMDVKLDGERMLCHREGKQIKWMTRNAKNYTDKYGPVLDRYILEGVGAHRCILDGEVVCWDDCTGSMVPFGHNRTYAKEELEGGGTGTRWLFFIVFDVLYAEGEGEEDKARVDEVIREAARSSRAPCAPGTLLKGGNITALPLDARRGVLRSLVTEHKHRFEIVKCKDVLAGDEKERLKQLSDFFDANAVQLNEEGLVIKDLHGHYEIGEKSRNSGLWVKMKPEYSDQSGDMDLIVLAAGYANGQMRSGLLSKFLVGVAVAKGDGSPPTEFAAVTTVGSGFTMDQLEDLNERTKGKWRSFEDRPSPHVTQATLRAVRGRDGLPLTRWIDPEDSFCLEIKCMEFVKRADWPSGCQMRFPRITRIRFDKGVEGCLDTTELAALLARPRQSPALSGGADGGVGAGGKRRKGRQGGQKGWGRAGKGVGVSSLFAVGGGDAGGAVDVKANVFVTGQGLKLEFCVVGTGFYTDPVRATDGVDSWWGGSGSKRKRHEGDEQLEKQELDELIKRHGGNVVANAHGQSTSFIVVGDTNSLTVKNTIGSRKYNVVGHRWVLECIERGSYEFPSFQHLRMASPDVRKHLDQIMDDYGDSYTQPTDATSLSQLLLNISMPTSQSPSGVGVGGARSGGSPLSSPSSSSWLSPLTDMDVNDRITLADSPDFIFADTDRCLVYCDMYQDLGSAYRPEGSASETGVGGSATGAEVAYNALGSVAAAIRLYGGDVAGSLCEGVTHVVVDPSDQTRYASISARIRDLHARQSTVFHVRVVNPGWVEHCIELGRLTPPEAQHVVRLSG